MNELSIKSGKYSKEIKRTLSKRFEIEEIEDCLKITYGNNEKISLINSLNTFIVIEAFKKQMLYYLLKRGKSKTDANSIIKRSIEKIKKSHYFLVLSDIRLKEYLKHNNLLNIESFITFNMRGFNEEVNVFVDKFLEMEEFGCEDDYFSEPGNYDVDIYEDLNEDDSFEIEIRKLYEEIYNKLQSQGIDIKDLQTIHMLATIDGISIESDSGLIINESFIEKQCGIVIESTDEDKSSSIYSLIVVSMLSNIVKVNRIYVHENIKIIEKDKLIAQLVELSESQGYKWEIVDCKGCDRCE